MDQIDQAILTDVMEKVGQNLKFHLITYVNKIKVGQNLKFHLITYVNKIMETDVVEHLNHLSVSRYKQCKCLQGGGVINPEFGWT